MAKAQEDGQLDFATKAGDLDPRRLFDLVDRQQLVGLATGAGRPQQDHGAVKKEDGHGNR